MVIFLKNVFPTRWRAENIPVVAGCLVCILLRICHLFLIWEKSIFFPKNKPFLKKTYHITYLTNATISLSFYVNLYTFGGIKFSKSESCNFAKSRNWQVNVKMHRERKIFFIHIINRPENKNYIILQIMDLL